MPADPLKLAALVAAALPAPGASDWEDTMRRIIARGHTAAYIAGQAERMGVTPDSPLISRERLSRAERRDIQQAIDAQYKYLQGFARERDSLSEAQVAARAELYAHATRKTYSAARWGDWELPFQPTEGSECMANCRCRWEVQDAGDGTGSAVWHLGAAERHCTTCPTRAADSPYSVKRRGA